VPYQFEGCHCVVALAEDPSECQFDKKRRPGNRTGVPQLVKAAFGLHCRNSVDYFTDDELRMPGEGEEEAEEEPAAGGGEEHD
jgi:hypothetical protein